MTVTAAQLAQLRRMTNEADSATYSDAVLTTYMEEHMLLDERGEVPYTWDTSTSPPTKEDNDDWIATYDLNHTAATIWGEKAADVADDFAFSADGGNYSRDQVIAQYQQRERHYLSRRAIGSIPQVMTPTPDTLDEVSYIGNLAELA